MVAMAWQVLGMSDATLAVKESLQIQNHLDQHGHQDNTILLEWGHQGQGPYSNAQSWDYASLMTTAFHASYNHT